jgi:hypothetical protein
VSGNLPFQTAHSRGAWRIVAALSAAACGSQGALPYGDQPPYGDIGFIGSGGGRYDGGRLGGDASTANGNGNADAGHAGIDAGTVGASDAGDSNAGGDSGNGDDDAGSSVGITFNLPPGFFAFLNWTIVGPAGGYSGTVHFGAARSLEFVVGGIQAGAGYTITLAGTDPDGQPCQGTSDPFTVSPGSTSGAGVIIRCATGDGAVGTTVTTGNVAVDAGLATGP